ncbi:ecdysone oxidase-like [Aphomia sociella]
MSLVVLRFYKVKDMLISFEPTFLVKITELECRLSKIESLYSEFDDLQAEAEMLCGSADSQERERDKFENQYLETVALACTMLANSRGIRVSMCGEETNSSNQQTRFLFRMEAVATAFNAQYVQSVLQLFTTTLQFTAYLYPESASIRNGNTYDYIVVGAGSAGSVIANRLSEDPSTTVLLIEAGGDPPFDSVLPSLAAYLGGSQVDWNYTSLEERSHQCHQNGVSSMTRGRTLGGSSSINYMIYARGDPHDFDTWADIVNDESWSYKNILQYFIKSEKLLDSEVLNSPNGIFHGTEGYLKVTRQPSDALQNYLDALKQLGHEVILDTNGNYTMGYAQSMYTIADGVRQSTAHAFLSTIKDRKNLYIAKNTLATKLIFDDYNNAVAIEVINENDEVITLNVNKEIILSAGSINTPQLLMLSGIGPRNHLQNMGIEVISDLPVGENLQDHPAVVMAYATEHNTTQKPLNPYKYPINLLVGYAALNHSQAYPDYQALCMLFDRDTMLQFCVLTLRFNYDFCQKIYDDSKGRELFFTISSSINLKSRGRILLRSLDPREHPIISLGHFIEDIDIDNAAAYLKDVNRIMSTRYFKEVNAELLLTPNCAGLEMDSDEFWRCHVLCADASLFHYAGTSAMGTVLDSRLRVSGVQRLRVVDCSIMPTITSGNTNAPTIMIAEKAADMIKQDNAMSC